MIIEAIHVVHIAPKVYVALGTSSVRKVESAFTALLKARRTVSPMMLIELKSQKSLSDVLVSPEWIFLFATTIIHMV